MTTQTEPFPRWKPTEHAHLIFHGGTIPSNRKHVPSSVPANKKTAYASMLTYSKWNSFRGVSEIHGFGINSSDFDVCKSKEGTLHVTHWGSPLEGFVGYRDISGVNKVGSKKPIKEMTDKEIRNLRHIFGDYRINTVEDHILKCLSLGQGASFERKVFIPESTFIHLMKFILSNGGQPDQFMWMSLPSKTGVDTLANAGAAGFKTGLLGGHGEGPTLRRGFFSTAKVTWVKGSSSYDHALVNGMVRLGASPASATRYGCSAGAYDGAAARSAVAKHGGNHGLWPVPHKR